MSDQDIIDTIAHVLGTPERSYWGDAEAVLAALRERYAITPYEGLRANRFTIVALPEPSEYTDDRGRMYNTYPFVGVKGDDITVGATCEFVYHINPHEARATALALLAAADYAEAATQI